MNQEEARRLFDYDAETGELTWKVSKGTVLAGAKAGTPNSRGYLMVRVNYKRYLAHRIIWLLVHGYFPEHCIDHINRTPADNRLKNLREVTQSCNMRNAGRRTDNTSGVAGVSWNKQRGKWSAHIRVNNRQYHLGLFTDFTRAVAHRLAAEQYLGWDGCDSSSDAYLFLKDIDKTLQNNVRMVYSLPITNTKGETMKANKIRINLVITQKNRDDLDRLSDETGLSISDIVRRLIDKATTDTLAAWSTSKTEDNNE